MVTRWVLFAAWMTVITFLGVVAPPSPVQLDNPKAMLLAGDGTDPMPLCRKCQQPPR